MLTYLTGTWPGIYTFDAGRLKVVDRAPVPPAPGQAAGENEKGQEAGEAEDRRQSRESTRPYVQ